LVTLYPQGLGGPMYYKKNRLPKPTHNCKTRVCQPTEKLSVQDANRILLDTRVCRYIIMITKHRTIHVAAINWRAIWFKWAFKPFTRRPIQTL